MRNELRRSRTETLRSNLTPLGGLQTVGVLRKIVFLLKAKQTYLPLCNMLLFIRNNISKRPSCFKGQEILKNLSDIKIIRCFRSDFVDTVTVLPGFRI